MREVGSTLVESERDRFFVTFSDSSSLSIELSSNSVNEFCNSAANGFQNFVFTRANGINLKTSLSNFAASFENFVVDLSMLGLLNIIEYTCIPNIFQTILRNRIFEKEES